MTAAAATARARIEIERAEAGLNPPPEDPRDFWTRVIESLRPWLGGNFKNGKTRIDVGVEGGAKW